MQPLGMRVLLRHLFLKNGENIPGESLYLIGNAILWEENGGFLSFIIRGMHIIRCLTEISLLGKMHTRTDVERWRDLNGAKQ